MTTPDPRMRASDTDRQTIVDRLAGHFTEGRLTASEYDQRVQQAYASTYLDELPALTADLPEPDSEPRRDAWQGFAAWSDGGPSGSREAGAQREHGGDGWQSAGRYGSGADWRRARWERRRRPRFAVLPVVVAVVLLLGLTHGWILIPLVWIGLALMIFGRRRGGCGHRVGPRSAP